MGHWLPPPGAEGPSAPPGNVPKTDTPTKQEVSDAAATVEALARALELHDYRRGHFGETAAHAARVTQFALMLAEQVAPRAGARSAAGVRLPPPRHRDDRRLERDALEAGAPHRGGARRDPRASVARRAHRRPGARARRPGAPGDRRPPRTLGRLGLSARAARHRDPARRRESSRSSTRSTRSRTTSRIATPCRSKRPTRRFGRRPASTSIPRSLPPSCSSTCLRRRPSSSSSSALPAAMVKAGRPAADGN